MLQGKHYIYQNKRLEEKIQSIKVDAQSVEKIHVEAKKVQGRNYPCDKEIFQESNKAQAEIRKFEQINP